MALRDHVEGRESIGVAALSVLMWIGICLLFGLPAVMMWIVGALLFLGGVWKTAGGTSDEDPPDGGQPPEGRPTRRTRSKKGPDESIYGPPE